jgi:hypothetical protein
MMRTAAMSGIIVLAAALGGAAARRSGAAPADRADLRGAWRSEVYTLKDGTRHEMPGLLMFTKTDWTTLWLITTDGKPVRGAGEGGTYVVSADKLTLTHLFNVSGGEAVTGLPATPLRLEVNAAGTAPTEPCTFTVDGARLVIHFPSGNQITFSRSSGF